MKIETGIKYCKGDSRKFSVRFLFQEYPNYGGYKFSISLHPRFWYWRSSYREFRITILGVNIHYRAV